MDPIRIYTIGNDSPKIDKQVININPSELNLEVDGKNGIRIISGGSSRNTHIEIKEDGEWKQLSLVTRIEVVIDCEEDGGLPKVKLSYYILPDQIGKQ